MIDKNTVNTVYEKAAYDSIHSYLYNACIEVMVGPTVVPPHIQASFQLDKKKILINVLTDLVEKLRND